jgi:hypothetical protein
VEYLILQALSLSRTLGPWAAGFAVGLLVVFAITRAVWGLFNKILDKRDAERQQLVSVLQAQVAQMAALHSQQSRSMDERDAYFENFCRDTGKNQVLTAKALESCSIEMRECRREASDAHGDLAAGMTRLSEAIAGLAGEVRGGLGRAS